MLRGTGASRNPYYTVGDKVMLRAIDACKENFQTGEDMVFHPGLNFLDSPQWKVEPPETIQELRLQRARQIRDEYDNIILMFSGGTDSTPILRTFVENNIKLDKIKIGRIGKWATLRDWEFEALVFPSLKKYLHEHNYSVPIEITSRYTFLEEHAHAWDYLEGGPCPVITPTGFQPWMMQDSFEFRKEKGNTCAIFGREKPTIIVSGGYWCWTALDKILFSQETNLNNDFVAVEEFYLTDKFPQIQIKLAWLKANYLERSIANRIDLDGLESDAMQPLSNMIGRYTADLLSLQSSLGPLYTGCCEAMDLIPIHPWLGSSRTHNTNPEFWIRDLKNAFIDNQHLLRDFEGYNKEVIQELPKRYFNHDDLYEDILEEETRVLSGIWGMAIPLKPFSRRMIG